VGFFEAWFFLNAIKMLQVAEGFSRQFGLKLILLGILIIKDISTIRRIPS
jgi:hypothetical protein